MLRDQLICEAERVNCSRRVGESILDVVYRSKGRRGFCGFGDVGVEHREFFGYADGSGIEVTKKSSGDLWYRIQMA